jgi:hypothetical protein
MFHERSEASASATRCSLVGYAIAIVGIVREANTGIELIIHEKTFCFGLLGRKR